MNYKLLKFGLPGKIAGSAEPGGHIHPETILQLTLELKTEAKPNNPKIPARVTSNLDYLHNNQITAIYNLTPNPSALIKYLWETEYAGTYITEINAVSIAIENCQPPTSEQLLLIVDDAITRMSKGENILFHCEGGLGRTGTILAAIYMKVEKDSTSEDAIKFIRGNYAKHAIDTSQENSLQSLYLSNNDLTIEAINSDKVKSILKSEVSSLALLDEQTLRQPEANLKSEDILESFFSNSETRKISNLQGVKEFGYESQAKPRSNPALQAIPGNQNVAEAGLNDTSSVNTLYSKVPSLLGSGNVKNLPKILRNDKVCAEDHNIRQTNDCCIVSYLTVLDYDNPLLNYSELIREAIKTKQFSNLLELGLDQGVAYCIIEATKQYGAEHVMNILFDKIKTPADEDILLAIQTTENAFGKPELKEIGFYDYTTRLNSNTIRIVQAISERLVNLQKLLLGEMHNKANLLTVNLLVLEDLFQLVASSTKIYISAPIYPNVEPDNNGFYAEIRDTCQNTIDISDSLLSYMGNSAANNYVDSYSYSDILIGLKFLDISVDSLKLIYEPTFEHFKVFVREAVWLGVIATGTIGYLPLVSLADILVQAHNGQYSQCFIQTGVTAGYMLLPTMLGTTFTPIYTASILAYSGYKVANNIYSLYSNYHSPEAQLKSNLAYATLDTKLGFQDMAKECLINAMKIVEKDMELNHNHESSIQHIAAEYDLVGKLCELKDDYDFC